MYKSAGRLVFIVAAAVMVCAAVCVYAGTIEAVQNGTFDAGLAYWSVAKDVSAWPVLQNDGSDTYVSLHPSSGFRGPLLSQSLNVTGISGATVTVSISLSSMYNYMTCGQSVAVYVDCVTSSGETKSIKCINPSDCGTPSTPISADVALPGDAARLTKVILARVDSWGQIFGDDVSVLVPDTATVGGVPQVTGISATSGSYGDELTITGTNFGDNSSGQGQVTIGGNGAGTISSWTDSQVVVAVGDPATSGQVRVISDGVESSGDFDYAVNSPNYAIKAPWSPAHVIAGQKATIPITINFNNGYTTSGINFSLSGSPSVSSSFSPTPVTGPGGTLLTLDSTGLPEGDYAWTVTAQTAGGPALTETVRLAVYSVGSIAFYGYDDLGNWSQLTSLTVDQQGQFAVYTYPVDSGGNTIEGYPSTDAVNWTSSDPSIVLPVKGHSGNWSLFANENGSATLTATSADGVSADLPVTVGFPTSMMFTGMSVSPASVTNSGTEAVTVGIDAVGFADQFPINFPGDINGTFSSGYDRYDGTGYVTAGTQPGDYAIVAGGWEKPQRAAALTITNDPATGIIIGSVWALPAPDGSSDQSTSAAVYLVDATTGSTVQTSYPYSYMALEPGRFVFAGVSPGTYYVQSQPSNSPVAPDYYQPQWFANAHTSGDAQALTVEAGQSIEDVNLFYKNQPLANPTIVSTNPADGATDVAINKSIIVTFDQAMDGYAFIFNGDTFTVEDSDGDPVYGQRTMSPDNMSVTFVPDSPLFPNATYTGKMTVGAYSSAGLHLLGDYQWTFTTGNWTIEDPKILAVYPQADAIDVSTNAVIWVVFDQQMDPSSFDSTALYISDEYGSDPGGDIVCDGSVVTLRPYWLDSYTTYTAHLSGSVRSIDGGSVGPDYVWSFTTGSYISPPRVALTVPADGATNVPLDIVVKACFDQQIDPDSVTSETFTLEDSGGNPVPGTVSSDGWSATFALYEPLAEGETYTAALTTGILNWVGYSLEADYAWSFTTKQALGDLTVVSVYPQAGAGDVSANSLSMALFDRALDPASIDSSSLTVVDELGDPVSGTAACDGRVLRFVPDYELGWGTGYTATISGTVSSADGVHYRLGLLVVL